MSPCGKLIWIAVCAISLSSNMIAVVRSCDLSPREVLGENVEIPEMRILEEPPFEKWLATGRPPLDDIDWRKKFSLGLSHNQMLPSPCGSCWAFGSTGALSDRIVIRSNGIGFAVSPQGLLDCGREAGSCNGGSHFLAYNFAVKTGLTDETCLPYRGMDNSNWGETPCGERMCRTCDRFGTCGFANQTLAVRVSEFGSVLGVDAMKAEILSRGPIACSMYAHSASFENYRGGIIRDDTRYDGTTHVVNVVGFSNGSDDENDIPHWIVRNSFGTNWGELGYYRVEMGKDIFNMESHNCSWAVPDPGFISQLKKRWVS